LEYFLEHIHKKEAMQMHRFLILTI